MSRLRLDWARLAVTTLVVLFALKATWGVLGTIDVGFDDETIYLEAAHWAGKRFLPLADSSPLYPLWYRALSAIEPDPVRLYFLNWSVLTASLPVLLFALARRSGAPLASAAVVAIAWSTSSALLTWPFVTKFAALVLGVGALAATTARDGRIAAAITAAALALASYARPELFMPSIAFAGAVATWSAWTLFGAARSPGPERRARVTASALACVIVVAAPVGLRKVFGDHEGGRAFFAFGQHYALNVVEDRHLAIDPWPVWDRFAREAFPHATTVGEALRENPTAFAWHLHRNLATLPTALKQLVRPPGFVSGTLADVLVALVALVALAGIVALGALVVRRERLDRRLAAWLPLVFVLLLTTAASALVIYPREHYLLPVVALGLAALAALSGRVALLLPAHRRLAAPPWAGRAAVVASVALLAVLVPTRRPTPAALLAPAEPAPLVHENLRMIAALRALRLRGPVVMLEPDHSRGVYAELDFLRVPQWEKNAPFWAFLHARQISVVVLNWRLRADPRFASDPEFVAFDRGEGEREDFELIPIEGTTATLAVRRSLRARSQ